MNLINAVKSMVHKSYDQYSSLDKTEESVSTFKQIMHKSATNLKFRMKLIDSPIQTLAQNGFVLPTGFNIRFVEDTVHTLNIPIPPFVGELAVHDDFDEHEKIQILIQKSISDIEFRKKLVADPESILKAEGFILPKKIYISILEGGDDLTYVVLPPAENDPQTHTEAGIYYNMDGNTLHIAGRIDTSTVEQLKAFLMRQAEQSLTIDLTDLNYISSIGLGLLLFTRKRLAQKGFALKIINIQKAVRNVFVLSGFDKIFEI